MAKKKDDETLKFLQIPIPEPQKQGKMTKVDWSGINYRNKKDTGEISGEMNISTHSAPYLTPSERKRDENAEGVCRFKDDAKSEEDKYIPLDICAYENMLIVQGVYKDTEGKIASGDDEENQKTNVNNYLYQIFDEKLVLQDSYVLKEYSHNFYSGAGVCGFRNFESYGNVTEIVAKKNILYFPAAYSRRVSNIVVLDKHFHKENFSDKQELNDAFSRYIEEYGKDKETYYYLECADDIVDGEKRYPGDKGSEDSLVYKKLYSRGGLDYYMCINAKTPWFHWEKQRTGKWRMVACEKYAVDAPKEIQGMPELHYTAVAHQRLFGINDACVYASGYNDYANWRLDTAEEYSAENAWMSSTQSTNGGNNTGIVAYGGSVFVFKKDSAFEITNTKNPFRINEVFSCGASDQKGIQVVGNYMIFVSEDSVMLYNGSSLKDIGYNLGISRVKEVVTGNDGRKFYMSVLSGDDSKRRMFVYDTFTGLWAEEEDAEFVGFAKTSNGFYALSKDSKIYRLDTGDYNLDWYVETDFVTNNTVDIKHIKKLQLLADMSPGSRVRAYILYDDEEFSEESSEKVFEKTNNGEKNMKLPIRVIPRKTANYGFKIRIEGHGFSKLYQMELMICGGGEKNISG